MKDHKIIITIGLLIVLGIGIGIWSRKDKTAPADQVSTEGDILGCYVSRTGKDVYTLNISEQKGEEVYGKLAFKNWEKDSSSGTFDGTYKDGFLLGDYAFRSEGMDSVMQVAFKRIEGGFVRGYGEVNAEGTEFVDPAKLTYDESSSLNVFRKEDCAEDVSYRSYSNDKLGIEFKYRETPDGYVLREDLPNAEEKAAGLVSTLVLERAVDVKAGTPSGGETPPAITIKVVKNDQKEWPGAWAESHSNWSNINLKRSEPAEYTVGGAKAVRYEADGLYASDTIVATHGEFAYVISGAYMDEASAIRHDFLPLVESIKFIPIVKDNL